MPNTGDAASLRPAPVVAVILAVDLVAVDLSSLPVWTLGPSSQFSRLRGDHLLPSAAEPAAGTTAKGYGHRRGIGARSLHKNLATVTDTRRAHGKAALHRICTALLLTALVCPWTTRASQTRQRAPRVGGCAASPASALMRQVAMLSTEAGSMKPKKKRKLVAGDAGLSSGVRERLTAGDGGTTGKKRRRQAHGENPVGGEGKAEEDGAWARAGGGFGALFKDKMKKKESAGNSVIGGVQNHTPAVQADVLKKKQKKNKRRSERRKAKEKREREREGGRFSVAETGGSGAHDIPNGAKLTGGGRYPFETDYNDHFETSLAAYRDIAPILDLYAQRLGKTRSQLRIYDPYFCAGAMVSHLQSLGFSNVHNTNTDCYRVWAERRTPDYDVLLTNPPFSGTHKERCLRQCVAMKKGWIVLLPSYCATKNYMAQAVQGQGEDQVFFAVPRTRYAFQHPEGTGKDDSPFFSLWFVGLGAHSAHVYREYLQKHNGGGKDGGLGLTLARKVSDLVAHKTAGVSTAKRLNPRQRAALKKKKFAP